MADAGGTVYLCFYAARRLLDGEHPINWLASVLTGSPFYHVELGIGDSTASNGAMSYVVRIFQGPVRHATLHACWIAKAALLSVPASPSYAHVRAPLPRALEHLTGAICLIRRASR